MARPGADGKREHRRLVIGSVIRLRDKDSVMRATLLCVEISTCPTVLSQEQVEQLIASAKNLMQPPKTGHWR